MKKYNNYGLCAKEAVLNGNDPINSWKIAIENNLTSKSSKIKACPKNAFLGLCEEGLVKGIKSGSFFKSKKPNLNKKYAITAVDILKENSNLSKKELWGKVSERLNLGNKRHNSQMDVVLALWEHGLIVK
jgi:hypothetical protein